MTELQQLFLFYVFIYYLIKGGIYVALYIGTIIAERVALQQLETRRSFYQKKRADERQNWKVAYSLYDRKQSVPTPKPLTLSQLVSNPNSFTAYSFVNSNGHKPLF
jgi:hypothetical protein